MKSVYRVFAFLVAAGVALQAAAIAYAVFGLATWIQAGGTLDKATMESETSSVGGETGFMLHGMVGMMFLPAVVLLFLIISFFAKVPGGVKWALIVFAVTVVQVALGLFAHELPGLGWLHGVNALILFGVAVSAALRVRTTQAIDERVHAQAV
jgi:hypothetical protein